MFDTLPSLQTISTYKPPFFRVGKLKTRQDNESSALTHEANE